MEKGRKKFLVRNNMNFFFSRDVSYIISKMFFFHVLRILILLSLGFYMETLHFMYIHNKESKHFKVKYIIKL